MNTIICYGVPVIKPELKYLESGTPRLSFRVPLKRKPSGKEPSDQWGRVTDWYGVVFFGKGASALYDLIMQGRVESVNVVGSLALRKWTDGGGATGISPDINAHEVKVAVWKDAEHQGTQSKAAPIPDDDF